MPTEELAGEYRETHEDKSSRGAWLGAYALVLFLRWPGWEGSYYKGE